jgi:Xaa-Pro aminopeptidase
MEKQLLDARIARLREQLDWSGMRGVLLSRPQHVYYFTGVMPGPSPALLLVSRERMLGIAPVPLGECETLTYVDYDIRAGWNVVEAVEQQLDRALSDLFPIGRVLGFERDHLPAAWVPVLLRHVRDIRDVKDVLWHLRRIKDAFELGQIETNIAGNDRMFAAVQAALRPGVSELDVWAVIQNTMCANAGGPVILEADLGVGVRGSNPDAKPGHEIIQAGETVFVDVYSATHNYYADTTRIFSVGAPDDFQKKIHAILHAALQAGEAVLRPGQPANQVDAAVRGVIESAGYGGCFPHHSGHAYGLFQQEKPYLVPAESMALEAGMIVTLEPGIYIPGWGGMRLEGNYVIEANGARRLDHFPSDLVVCG